MDSDTWETAKRRRRPAGLGFVWFDYGASVRIARIEMSQWRNISGVTIDLAPDADFLCLIGENGTGKSHTLDLLHLAAHHFGLAHQLTSKRQPPWSREEPYEVAVTLDLGDQSQSCSEGISAELRPALGTWDGKLIFESAGRAKEPDDPPPAPPDPSNNAGALPKLAWWTRVLASGIPNERDAFYVAGHVTQRLRAARDVLHLYIDAERVFPPGEVRDDEVLALARRDLAAPEWVREQAAILTQNLYLEWMRAMLAQQQQLQSAFFQAAQEAHRAGAAIPPPEDFLDHYRQTLRRVLPHLEFLRLDQDRRRLIFNSAGGELPYEELSGGERELAFLVGQIERFGVRQGLFLLDEPELHLNAQLLRGWLDYLREAIDTGQVWIATHALEAAEAAGLEASLVLERDHDRIVRTVAPLGGRPVLQTLAGQLGSPAFSIARSRFLLIEGDRPGRERERFARLLAAPESDRYLESGGCREVLAKLDALRLIASEEEQLKVGAFVDRDFRTEDDIREIEQQHQVCVLPVHEVENFFLHPAALTALAAQAGKTEDDAFAALVGAADQQAGRWILERTAQREKWDRDLGAAQGAARGLTWADIDGDPATALQPVVDAIPDLRRRAQLQHRGLLVASAEEYRRLRYARADFWQECFGKEALRDVAPALGFANGEALEDRAVLLWRTEVVPRPDEIQELQAYIDAIPALA